MKKYYQIIKIGNSLFVTLPNKLAKKLDIKSGDQVFYETVAGKKQLIINLTTQTNVSDIETTINELNAEDKKWVEETSGSLP